MRERLGKQLARLKAVCLGEGGDGAWEPIMKDTITPSLPESFHPCVAVPRKWAPEVRHTCSFAHFPTEANGKHAVLFAMLMDPTVKPPVEDDFRVINQRKSSKTTRKMCRESEAQSPTAGSGESDS